MTAGGQRIDQRRTHQAAAEHHDSEGPTTALPLRALRSGSLASVLSTLVVSMFSRSRSGTAAAGTNATSQWFWYPRARHTARPSPKYTLAGYAVHHASSLFWAIGYEALRPDRSPPAGRIIRAAGVAAVAYVVDYHVVPRRLSPGFEHRIGPAGIGCAYAAFALGLYIATSLASRRRSKALTAPPARKSRRVRTAPEVRSPDR
ncbi:hypothetical protein [Luteimonas sp. SDU101]|uniref:hypothetical protein n=1 Tax=Luteimonas sp. SDU101 TaxID=3422593 RepID=UPI003EB98BA3